MLLSLLFIILSYFYYFILFYFYLKSDADVERMLAEGTLPGWHSSLSTPKEVSLFPSLHSLFFAHPMSLSGSH